ncbi:MAG: 16S rRNA (adenine(1518)-N(6)/adenine(1519)-N(6))-dimethyltransferase RsmA [Caldiserica bacterium]|nr:16S rRNA (adenine(1518)-N(6)/adenine(1519)-N(6))-dimethyltransferase RsmA [Caldisericota bacterium]
MNTLTPTALRDLLKRTGVVLSKRFGQNFLVDGNVLASMAPHFPSGENVVFVEVGAGALALTGVLAERGKRVVAYEIDQRLRKVHEALLADDSLRTRIELRYEDALEADWCALGHEGETLVLMGNLPYLRSSEIVLKLIRTDCIAQACLLFQREFATRLAAHSGNGDYSSLSVVAQTFFDITRLLELSPDVFFPRPEVSSTLLGFLRRPSGLEDAEVAPFMRFVQQSFLHRRKKLADFFRRLGVPLAGEFAETSQLRPEALTPSEFIDLFRAVSRVTRH